MRPEQLLKLASKMVVTPEDVERMKKRLDQADKKYIDDAKFEKVTTEFLNKVYSI